MVIDCDSCAVRGRACGDCVMTVLLGHSAAFADAPFADAVPATGTGEPAGRWEIDEEQQRAFGVLAEAGMVPHLRMVPTAQPRRAVRRRAG